MISNFGLVQIEGSAINLLLRYWRLGQRVSQWVRLALITSQQYYYETLKEILFTVVS